MLSKTTKLQILEETIKALKNNMYSYIYKKFFKMTKAHNKIT